MTKPSASFAPDWVSPPGETIFDLVEERGWTQAELAVRLGYSEKHVSQLINGKVPLTDEAAIRLERVLGGSVSFWLTREAKYREHSARLEAERTHEQWSYWLDELPVRELMASGAIEKRRVDERQRPGIVAACLRFFGVASPDEWRSHYGNLQCSFRRTRADQSDIGAISAWLRLGERCAEKLEVEKYDRSKFNDALLQIRSLTCESPPVFEPKLKRLLQEAGVTFVLVPSIPRARVSGVARWLSPTRPMIQLSLFGKTNDKFWFTFFHEAAHILLHSGTKEEKRSVFLDDSAGNIEDKSEHEANQWAANLLIPQKFLPELSHLKNKEAVCQFARRAGIHPGIVVGRLQHSGLIEPSWMNDLKDSFTLRTVQ